MSTLSGSRFEIAFHLSKPYSEEAVKLRTRTNIMQQIVVQSWGANAQLLVLQPYPWFTLWLNSAQNHISSKSTHFTRSPMAYWLTQIQKTNFTISFPVGRNVNIALNLPGDILGYERGLLKKVSNLQICERVGCCRK